MASKKKRNRPRPKAPAKPAASRPAGQAKPSPADKAPRERTGPTRAERLAAAETARRRRATRNRALFLGGIVAVVTLLVVTVTNSRRSNARVVSALEASGACQYDSRSDTDAGTGRNHVSGDQAYEVDPPAGGNHDPAAAAPGIFTAENRPSDSRIVHSMEHGYVVFWHRPDLDQAALDELRGLAGRYDRDVLVVPRESLTQPVAATAWHRRLLCSRPDVTALERFVTEYRNEGPEDVPH